MTDITNGSCCQVRLSSKAKGEGHTWQSLSSLAWRSLRVAFSPACSLNRSITASTSSPAPTHQTVYSTIAAFRWRSRSKGVEMHSVQPQLLHHAFHILASTYAHHQFSASSVFLSRLDVLLAFLGIFLVAFWSVCDCWLCLTSKFFFLWGNWLLRGGRDT